MKVSHAERCSYPATLIALVLSGLSAGFFYTWSVTVMTGLDAADPRVAISAMNAVNAEIRSVWFAAIFFGAPLSTLVAGLVLAWSNERKAAAYAGAGLVGAGIVVVITFTMHVPWNEALAATDIPVELGAATVWRDYSSKWTAWNHGRSAAGALAFVLMAFALKSIRR